jgi:hypothetical protein
MARWKNNRYLFCKNNLSGYGVPASQDAGCGFLFDYNEMGVFHGGFASSSSQLFASASHGGVTAGLLFPFSRYHTFGVWACYFLINTEAATFSSLR